VRTVDDFLRHQPPRFDPIPDKPLTFEERRDLLAAYPEDSKAADDLLEALEHAVDEDAERWDGLA
jgi:hypothetical protein